MHWFILGVLILLHWFMCRLLCQYHIVLITYSFVIQFKMKEHDKLSFVLLSQNCLCYSRSFVAVCKFQDYLFQFCEKCMGVFLGIPLNLQIALDGLDIFNSVNPSMHEHSIFTLLFMFSVAFINVLQFPVYTSFTSLGKFIPRSFILFVVVVVLSLKSRIQLCNHKDCSSPGFPVLHHLPELAQTYVH